MENKPLVSIAMGVYNAERTLRKCIDSIREQTYSNWELIVCNDCSLDRTQQILKKYQDEDQRIRVINNDKNRGLAYSLNECIRQAKGKYFARVDDDDLCLPQRLERQVSFLENHPQIDIVGTSMIVFDESGDCGIRYLPSKLTRDSFLKGSPFAHPTVMIKTKLIRELHGYDTSVGRAEDLNLWFRLYKYGGKGVNLTTPLYKYHETTNDYQKRSLKNGYLATKVMLDGYQQIGIPLLKRWRAFRPMASALIPNKLMRKYHKNKLR